MYLHSAGVLAGAGWFCLVLTRRTWFSSTGPSFSRTLARAGSHGMAGVQVEARE